MIVENLNYQDQDEVERTIVDLIDVETGEEVDANKLLTSEVTNKEVFSKIRETLVLAQRKGKYQYVCAHCLQPVKLMSRFIRTRSRESNYFQHFNNSKDCPVKSSFNGDAIKQAVYGLEIFKQGHAHSMMSNTLRSFLEKDDQIHDIKPVRGHDLGFFYNDIHICIDFQLYSTYLTTIIDRIKSVPDDSFGMWIFPYFSVMQQKICARDTYFKNKRNVFVLDSKQFADSLDTISCQNHKYAIEESVNNNELMLNCYWQKPVMIDGLLQIEWNCELVRFSDLKFDPVTKSVYYHDCDIDFYENSSEDVRLQVEEWEKKLDSLRKERDIILRKRSEDAEKTGRKGETKEERKIREIKERLVCGEPHECFYDSSIGKYGYKLGDTILIEAKYYDSFEFSENGLAIVRRSENGNCGAINLLGRNVIGFSYSSLHRLPNNFYIACRNRVYSLYSDTGQLIKVNFGSHYLSWYNCDTKLGKIMYVSYHGFIVKDQLETNAKISYYKLYDLDGNLLARPFVQWDHMAPEGDVIRVIKDGLEGLMDFNGQIIEQEPIDLSFGLKKQCSLGWKLLRKDGDLLSDTVYSSVGEFYGKFVIVSQNRRTYYLLDKDGNDVLHGMRFNAIEYDGLYFHLHQMFSEDVMDSNGLFLPQDRFCYSDTVYTDRILSRRTLHIVTESKTIDIPDIDDCSMLEGDVYVRLNNKKCGIFSAKGKPLVPIMFDNIEKKDNGNFSAFLGYRRYEYLPDGTEAAEYVPLENGNKIKKFLNSYVVDPEGNRLNENDYIEIEPLFVGYLKAYEKSTREIFDILDNNGRCIHKDIVSCEDFGLGYYRIKKVNDLLGRKSYSFALWSIDDNTVVLDYGSFINVTVYKDYLIVEKSKQGGISKCNLLGKTGKYILPENYDWIIPCKDNVLKVKKKGKWGLIKLPEPSLWVQCEYNRIDEVKPGSFKATYADGQEYKHKMFYIKPKEQEFNFTRRGVYTGMVTNIKEYGLFVSIKNVGVGLCHISELKKYNKSISDYHKGDQIEVECFKIDIQNKKASLRLNFK